FAHSCQARRTLDMQAGALHWCWTRGRFVERPLQNRQSQSLVRVSDLTGWPAFQGRNNETIVRHLVSLSPGVSVVGLGPVPPQSCGSKAALVVLNFTCPSPQRTLRPYGFLPLVWAMVPQVSIRSVSIERCELNSVCLWVT